MWTWLRRKISPTWEDRLTESRIDWSDLSQRAKLWKSCPTSQFPNIRKDWRGMPSDKVLVALTCSFSQAVMNRDNQLALNLLRQMEQRARNLRLITATNRTGSDQVM